MYEFWRGVDSRGIGETRSMEAVGRMLPTMGVESPPEERDQGFSCEEGRAITVHPNKHDARAEPLRSFDSIDLTPSKSVSRCSAFRAQRVIRRQPSTHENRRREDQSFGVITPLVTKESQRWSEGSPLINTKRSCSRRDSQFRTNATHDTPIGWRTPPSPGARARQTKQTSHNGDAVHLAPATYYALGKHSKDTTKKGLERWRHRETIRLHTRPPPHSPLPKPRSERTASHARPARINHTLPQSARDVDLTTRPRSVPSSLLLRCEGNQHHHVRDRAAHEATIGGGQDRHWRVQPLLPVSWCSWNTPGRRRRSRNKLLGNFLHAPHHRGVRGTTLRNHDAHGAARLRDPRDLNRLSPSRNPRAETRLPGPIQTPPQRRVRARRPHGAVSRGHEQGRQRQRRR